MKSDVQRFDFCLLFVALRQIIRRSVDVCPAAIALKIGANRIPAVRIDQARVAPDV
jgi:hypothetical protein